MRYVYHAHPQFYYLHKAPLAMLYRAVDRLEPVTRDDIPHLMYRGHTTSFRRLWTNLYREIKQQSPENRFLETLRPRVALIVQLDDIAIYHLRFPEIQRGRLYFPIKRSFPLCSDPLEYFKPYPRR